MSTDDTLSRLRAIEDTLAIQRLKAAFTGFLDAGNWEQMGKLLSEDAVAEFPQGTFTGRKEIVKIISSGVFSFTMHFLCNPIIEVRNNEATGSWYVLCAATDGSTQEAFWILGRYNDLYVKRENEWKIGRITFKLVVSAPYHQDWAQVKAE
jgi:hypothetical protein